MGLDVGLDGGLDRGLDGSVDLGADLGVNVGRDGGIDVKRDEELDGGVLPAPHLLHVMVSDWGYNCVGFNNPGFDSPFIDSLAATGIRLNHFVTDPVSDRETSDWMASCSETRYLFLSCVCLSGTSNVCVVVL